MMFICEFYQPINPNLLAYTRIKHNLRIFLTALYIPSALPHTYVSRVHKKPDGWQDLLTAPHLCLSV